ncbi:putative Tetratricopeptide TPR_2 repeat protein [Verrucomicrobia bacterium]|nr:putative Tetratricopeptide TPR_2 repeat protein [Verrucomicrobiota bacterium]
MDRTHHARRTAIIASLLATVTLAVFWPVCHHDFLSYDDAEYVTDNPHVLSGLSWANLGWALGATRTCNWLPVTWMSHILDVQLFGLNPGAHHLTSLILHAANAVLLFLLLQRLTGACWCSSLVAALFALHPLHVESVAWLAERKDVLSAFFFILTLWAYARYAAIPARGRTIWYCLALLLFALGLMSKPMLVTLPFVLLLLDYWPLRRLESKSQKPTIRELLPLLTEKLPFFALSAASCTVTFLVQNAAMVNPAHLPIVQRLGNAAVACVAYLWQTFWPARLAIFYPYPLDLPTWKAVACACVLIALTGAFVRVARRWPFAVVGWLWYLGMLVPVIGLVQVGAQARADRYTYLPLIGVFILLSRGAAALMQPRILTEPAGVIPGKGASASSPPSRQISAETEEQDQRRQWSGKRRWLLAGGASAVLAGLGCTARQQVQYWQNSQTVFEHAARVTKDNYVALTGLGIVALRQADLPGAMDYLQRALEYARPHGGADLIKYYVGAVLQMQGKGLEALPYLQEAMVGPSMRPERNCRLGACLLEAGRLEEAEAAIKEAIEAEPNNPDFRLALAMLRHKQGQPAQAEALFRDVIAEHPELGKAHRTFADFLLVQGRSEEAQIEYAAAIKLLPADFALHRAYATALTRQGKTKDAIAQLEAALRLEPRQEQAIGELAELLSQVGSNRQAVLEYNRCLEVNSNSVTTLNNLAWLLATNPDDQIRDGPRAVELAERACRLTQWQAPVLLGTLAAAYAEAGRFQDAVAMAERAQEQAKAANLPSVAARNARLLELYRQGKAWREE